MYVVRKIYEGVKAIPASVYEIAFSAGVIALASFLAMRSPSELEKKVAEQKYVAPAGGGGGSAGPHACPPIIKPYDHKHPAPGGSFGEFDSGGFDSSPFNGDFEKKKK